MVRWCFAGWPDPSFRTHTHAQRPIGLIPGGALCLGWVVFGWGCIIWGVGARDVDDVKSGHGHGHAKLGGMGVERGSLLWLAVPCGLALAAHALRHLDVAAGSGGRRNGLRICGLDGLVVDQSGLPGPRATG